MIRSFSCSRHLWLWMRVAIISLCAAQQVHAQNFAVLHTFTGGADGATPYWAWTIDRSGNLYGGTFYGGNSGGWGIVYKMTHRQSGWGFQPLYTFTGGRDGGRPSSLAIGNDGGLYGAALDGGTGTCQQVDGTGCGVIFILRPSPTPPPTIFAPWNETVLYSFAGPPNDGERPVGNLAFDSSNTVYGTTVHGGLEADGTVFALTRSGSGWSESVLHNFTGLFINEDGSFPLGGVIMDASGALFGTTYQGGINNAGTVFEVVSSGGTWVENIIATFEQIGAGYFPSAALISDSAGNLYSTANNGGDQNGGTVFQLSPSEGGWNYNVLYGFLGTESICGPVSPLTMDGSGNLYGTTLCDGAYSKGSVFKLTRSNGGWTYTTLHDFTGGSDGEMPYSGVVMDASGNLYGTTSSGGSLSDCGGFGCGTVYEITQ